MTRFANPILRRRLRWCLLAAGAAFAALPSGWSQSHAGVLNRPRLGDEAFADRYDWQGLRANASATQPGPVKLSLDSSTVPLADGSPFQPWVDGPLPIQVSDPAQPSEVLSLSLAACAATCVAGIYTVPHSPQVTLSSATRGLQEAINDLAAAGGTVMITGAWQGTNAILAAATLPANVLLEDRRGGGRVLYSADPVTGSPRLLWQMNASGLQARSLNQIRKCDLFPGADAGQQLNNCIADLPPNGGIADGRGLVGSQTAAAPILLGAPSRPVTLLLGAMQLTSTASPAVVENGSSWLIGLGAGATILQDSAAGANVVEWHGSHGGMSNIALTPLAGAADGLLLSDTVAGEVQYNAFRNVVVSCATTGANDAVRLQGTVVGNSAPVAMNDFYNLNLIDCENSVHLTAINGALADYDNDFFGGQYRNTASAGNGFLIDSGAQDNVVYGGNIAQHIDGVNLSAAANNSFIGSTIESTTNVAVIDATSADNSFLGVSGTGGFLDAGIRTSVLGGANNWGAGGGNVNQSGGSFAKFGLLASNGSVTSITPSASGSYALSLPAASTLLAGVASTPCFVASGTCSTSAIHTNLGGIGVTAVLDTPNANYGYPLAAIADSSGRNLILASQDLNTSAATWRAISISTPPGAPNNIQATENGNEAVDVLNLNTLGGGVSIGGGTPIVSSSALAQDLSGTTGPIGGTALAAGACLAGTVSVTGASAGMAILATPVTFPGAGFNWNRSYVSAPNTVTVQVCADIAGTPAASAYNVRVLR